MTPAAGRESTRDPSLDVVIVGAGFAGLYLLHKLRSQGFEARILEAGSGVGGVWYWNRYPGARCDIPILNYSYSFSKELRDEWRWSERYAAQPEIERYANFVADRLGLRDFIDFDTEVAQAVYDEPSRSWVLTSRQGSVTRARFCMMATGGFSVPVAPDIEGLDRFEGEIVFTSRWPAEGLDVAGRRLGVIGTGSSGVQTITALGRTDEFEALHVFQRTPNYTAPSHNSPLDEVYLRQFQDRFTDYWATVLKTGTGTFNDGPEGPVGGLSDEELTRRMDEAWAVGGPSTLLGVSDLLMDEDANKRVGAYLRARVRERVQDPETAEALCAHSLVGARRTVYENGYYEVYNNPKVELVDLRRHPIVRAGARGIETTHRSYDLDVLILATGFDSSTGALLAMDIRGRDGLSLRDHWRDGPRTYLGMMTSSFPNLFMVTGPGSPSIRSNLIVSIEHDVEWISSLLDHLREAGQDEIEPSTEAEAAWTGHVADVADATLVTREDTQYIGSNIPGKPRVFLAYIGGVATFRAICERIAERGYEGFEMRPLAGDRSPEALRWSGPPANERPGKDLGVL